MKPVSTSRKLSAERIKVMIANTPEAVDDPDPVQPERPQGRGSVLEERGCREGRRIAAVRAALAEKRKPGQRGPGKRPPKVAINFRLSCEVLDAFKATGSGWQTKVDGALKEWLKDHTPA